MNSSSSSSTASHYGSSNSTSGSLNYPSQPDQPDKPSQPEKPNEIKTPPWCKPPYFNLKVTPVPSGIPKKDKEGCIIGYTQPSN